ncbi:MAG TPA: c-type cytochrome [Burkholderiales bacterium]|jgi:mono/diheme cytochrome c family protein|nr:c-type cytochrome [Burkholderiales bacterium]
MFYSTKRRLAAVLFGAACTVGGSAVLADEVPELNPYSGDKKAMREGQSWYRGVCATCHGGRADGQGERGTGADLRKFDKGFREFVAIVKNGRQVQGRAQFMPAWGGVIKDEDIYKIAAYLETLALEGANWKEAKKH